MEQLETSYQNKLEAQVNLIERLKLEHAKETEKLKIESENALKDIKYIYDQEKMVLDGRMEKQNNTIKILQMRKDSANTNNLTDLRSQYLEEIQQLNLQLENFRQSSIAEIEATRQEKDAAMARGQELEEEVRRMGDEIARAQENTRKTRQDSRQGTDYQNRSKEEINEYKREIQQLQREIQRLKSVETKARDLESKEDRRVHELKEVQQELHFEKKKALEAQLENNETKTEYDKKKEVILEEIVNKDEELKIVKRQYRGLEKEVERLQQIIQKHQMCKTSLSSLLAVCAMPLQQSTTSQQTRSAHRDSSLSNKHCDVPPLDTSSAMLYNQTQQHQPSNRSLTRCLSQQSMFTKNTAAGCGGMVATPVSGQICSNCGESERGKARMRGNSSGMLRSPPRSSTSMSRPTYEAELSPMQMQQSDSIVWKKVKAQDLKLLKTCQMMVDAAGAMECSVCSSLYQTEQFLEHISSSSCFLDNYQSMQYNGGGGGAGINTSSVHMNGLQRAQSQGMLRMSQQIPSFEGVGTTTNPLLFTPMSSSQQHQQQMEHENYHQVNISSLGDDLSAITGGEHVYAMQDRPLSPRDMLQSPHAQYPIRASHNFAHFPQQHHSIAQFFPAQRSQPLSARSQASIISQSHQQQQQQMIGAADMSQMMQSHRILEEKLRSIELQLKEKENYLGDIKNQRDRQQLEYDKLQYELRQVKKESVENQEKKTENEHRLKNEINFLLQRLLKTKDALAETQEAKENLTLTLQKQKQQLIATSPIHESILQQHQNSQNQSPSRVLLATPNQYNDEVSFSSQLSGSNNNSQHYHMPSGGAGGGSSSGGGGNTRYQAKGLKHHHQQHKSYMKKPQINESGEDHKVAQDYSYYEQYSLLPVQRHNESHYNPISASMYQHHQATSVLHSTKGGGGRAASPNSVAKSLSTFVQNSPLQQKYGERVGDSRVLPPPSYNVSHHRQTPSSPKGRKPNSAIPGSRKQQRSFHQEMNASSSHGSPKRHKSGYRTGSHRKGVGVGGSSVVQNMPHFTKKTIKDLNAHDDY